MKYINIDQIIERLTTAQQRIAGPNILEEHEILYLISTSENAILSDPTLLKIETPVNIIGDIHGQFFDLLRYFEMEGFPPTKKYLFLGNYINRGEHSIETICLLVCYKIKFPDRVFLLRGNHESRGPSGRYGLYESCKRFSGSWIWRRFLDLFNILPVAAIIDNNIFCVHGGLSPDIQTLDQIRQLPRPSEVPKNGLLCDLLWSDPSPFVDLWGESERGVSFTFGARAVEMFLSRFNFDFIIRSSEVVDGFYFFTEGLLSIFSAPNYCGEGNNGVLLKIDEHGAFAFKFLHPIATNNNSETNCLNKSCGDEGS